MEQSEKEFLRHMFIGATSVPAILQACKKETRDAGSGSRSAGYTLTHTISTAS